MSIDNLVDTLVQHVNAAPREPKWENVTPPSVRVGALFDEASGWWDWNIKRDDTINWVDALEAHLPGRFPLSFRSLITRYIFPPFEMGDLELLANTREGVDRPYELRTGIFEDKFLSAALLKHGFIQFARPVGGGYDPICFDTKGKCVRGEYPVTILDHESLLCHDKIKVTRVIAPSFPELIERHLAT